MEGKLTEDDLNESLLSKDDEDFESLEKELEQDEREQRDAPMGEPSLIDWL